MIHDVLPLICGAPVAALMIWSQLRRFARTHPLARIVLFLLCVPGFTASAQAATLWQVWQLAQVHDPEFRAAAATLRKARAAKPGALSALLPQVNGTLSRNYDNNSSEGPQFFGNDQILPVSQASNTGTTNWQIELDQPLFNWSAIKKVQAANLDAAAAAATYQDTLAQLAVKATTAYVTALYARATLVATQETVKGFAEQSREADARYHAGMTGVIGADTARAGLESARGELLAARQQLTAAINALEALIGGPLPGPEANLPTDYTVTTPGGQEAWIGRALAGNPRLAAARLGARADSRRIGAAESGYLPNISLALIHNEQIQSGSSSYSFPGQVVPTPADYDATGNEIAVQLDWNFFAGGATRAAVTQARAQADQSAATAATTRLDVTREVKTRYAALQVDAQRLKTLRSAVAAARDAVEATTLGVKAGVRTEDDLVTLRERLLAAEQARNAAIATAVEDQAALDRAAGILNDAQLHALSLGLAVAPASASAPVPATNIVGASGSSRLSAPHHREQARSYSTGKTNLAHFPNPTGAHE